MKKVLVLFTVCILLVACADITSGNPNKSSSSDISLDLKPIKLGLVTTVGGIDDDALNDMSWEGILLYAKNAKLPEEDYDYKQSLIKTDYYLNLRKYAESNVDLIIAPCYEFDNELVGIIDDYKNKKFLLINTDIKASNVVSLSFAEQEGAYLAGVTAALKTKAANKQKVGFIGGEDIELIQRVEAGFEQGVAAVDPDIEILKSYTGNFENSLNGLERAEMMYDKGVYVIYQVAGKAGEGVFKAAIKNRENGNECWVIGSEGDQYDFGLCKDGKSVTLTSIVKKIKSIVYQYCKLTATDEFEAAVVKLGLKDNVIGLPLENPNLNEAQIKELESYKNKIIKGEINILLLPKRLR